MPVKADLTLNAPVTAEDDVEAKEAPEAIDQILECTVVLVAWSSKALFDMIAHLGDIHYILSQETAESLARSVNPLRVIQCAYQIKDLVQRHTHRRTPRA
jgi:hypothetical protein